MVDLPITSLSITASGNVSRVGSSEFYGVAGGNSRKIPGDVMQNALSRDLGVLCVRSTNFNATTTLTPVSWEDTEYDGGPYWNSSSASLIYFPDNRIVYASFGAQFRMSTNTSQWILWRMHRNGGSFFGFGGAGHGDESSIAEAASFQSGPVLINSGDYYEIVVRTESVTEGVNGSFFSCWFYMKPELIR